MIAFINCISKNQGLFSLLCSSCLKTEEKTFVGERNVSNLLCIFVYFYIFLYCWIIEFFFYIFCILCFERLDLLAQKVIAVLCQMDNFQIQLQSFSRKFKCWLPFSLSFKSKEITNIISLSQVSMWIDFSRLLTIVTFKICVNLIWLEQISNLLWINSGNYANRDIK